MKYTQTSLKQALKDVRSTKRKRGLKAKDVTVSHGDVSTITLPDGMEPSEAVKWIEAFDSLQNQPVNVSAEIKAFPMDGAYALAQVLSDLFGWTNMVPTPGFFGDTPPQMVTVPVGPGPGETIQIPWGRITVPGLDGFLAPGFIQRGKMFHFRIQGKCLKKHESIFQGIVQMVKDRVAKHSIYQGKAIRVSFRDEDNELLESFDPDYCPTFWDLSSVNEDELIFDDDIMRQIEAGIYASIEFPEGAKRIGMNPKRGFLLEGPPGTGKTMTGRVIAKKCVEQGRTFIKCENVCDLAQTLDLAVQFQPACVYAEDLDRAVGLSRDEDVDKLLNTLDGVDTKDSDIITVLTTNAVKNIADVAIRKGRVDVVIPVRQPSPKAAARLVRVYGGDYITGTDEELQDAVACLDGAAAATYREVVENAKGAWLYRTQGKGELMLTPDDIATSARQQLYHEGLMRDKPVTKQTPMGEFGKQVGVEIARAYRDCEAAALTDQSSEIRRMCQDAITP